MTNKLTTFIKSLEKQGGKCVRSGLPRKVRHVACSEHNTPDDEVVGWEKTVDHAINQYHMRMNQTFKDEPDI